MELTNQKEYGGFLPLELAKGNHYYQTNGDYEALALASGRCAALCAIKDFNPSKIYIPYYNCRTCTEAIINSGIPYEYYYLDNDLTPLNINPLSDEMVFWINYYGNASEDNIQKVMRSYENLIIDNTQAFFAEPVLSAYNCYSARKFFGVSDGAYLVKDKLNAGRHFERDQSYSRADFLLKSIELGTNAAYNWHLHNEELLKDDILLMSKLTSAILCGVDYEKVKTKRRANLIALHSYLFGFNKFCVNLDSNTHMVLPFRPEKRNIREYLIQNKIYTPTWWRHVPDLCGHCGESDHILIETELTENMVFLPIDQRYDENDMKDIADIIRRGL